MAPGLPPQRLLGGKDSPAPLNKVEHDAKTTSQPPDYDLPGRSLTSLLHRQKILCKSWLFQPDVSVCPVSPGEQQGCHGASGQTIQPSASVALTLDNVPADVAKSLDFREWTR